MSYTPKGVEQAKHIWNFARSRGLPIILKGDPDVDGLLAYGVAKEILKKIGVVDFYCTVNRDRLHGLCPEELEDLPTPYQPLPQPEGIVYIEPRFYKNCLIINVDSSISGSELQMLVDNGNIVLSFDHHDLELEGFSPTQRVFKNKEKQGYAVLMNNQYPDEPEEWRFLSGTSVTMYGLSAILDIPVELEWECMQAISLLSDVREIENPLAKGILKTLYETKLDKIPIVRKLAIVSQYETPDLFQHSLEYLDRTFIDYSLSPYINACYQLNLSEMLFKIINFKPTTWEPVKTVRKAILNNLESALKVTHLSNMVVLTLKMQDIEKIKYEGDYDFSYTSFIGLLANRYLGYRKPVFIIAIQDKTFMRGSVRGISFNLDYKEVFMKLGYECKGHTGAFGVTKLSKSSKMSQLNDALGILHQGYEGVDGKIIVLKDLLANHSELLSIATENEYLLSQNFIKIKFKGLDYSVKRETAGMIIYEVNGLEVRTFDKELHPKNSYIIPSWEDNSLKLTLKN